MNDIETVSIELKPGVYSQFRALNNTVWFALSEYVDNSVQSYLNNKERLLLTDTNYKLVIEIAVNWEAKQMTIEDNAAGIDSKNFQRAFEPANKHMNGAGLNEFGMGMKTASIWFSDKWRVYTKALGEDVERVVEFDLKKVTAEQRENLSVVSTPKSLNEHYTKILLTELSDHFASNVMEPLNPLSKGAK